MFRLFTPAGCFSAIFAKVAGGPFRTADHGFLHCQHGPEGCPSNGGSDAGARLLAGRHVGGGGPIQPRWYQVGGGVKGN
jgi:hypothetical protein